MRKALLASLLAATLPLVLPLARNLEYEYASLNAYLALILLPLLTFRSHTLPSLQGFLQTLWLVLLVNILPGCLLFKLHLCPCTEGEFYSFWLVQTMPHLIWGSVIGVWMQSQVERGRSPTRLLSIFFAGLCLILLHLAATLWFYPQKRATHLLAGFIHGAIYDNWIPMDAGILWARGGHILLALTLLTLVLVRQGLWRWVSGGSLLFASLFALTHAQTWPSQGHGLAVLLAQMPEQRPGPGFILHYRTQPTEPIAEARLEELYQSAAFHSQDLMRILAVSNPQVHIFVYPNQESKKLWFGGDGTDITDVVTPSIHITPEAWPHPTLRHELVHAIASRFAYHGLGFHPNMAFTEGLAVALAPSEDEMSLHEGAADILQNKRLSHLENLFSPMFWSESGRRAYTVAGSLLLYLLQEGGLGKVKALYAGSSWESAFGQSPTEVFQAWQGFLRTHYPSTEVSLQAEALFRYPGLLQDLCPHSKATLSKGGPSFGLKMRQPPNWNPSRDYWPWRVDLEKDPASSVALLRQRLQTEIKDTDLEDFERTLQAMLQKPPKVQEDVDLFLLHIDTRILQGQKPQAMAEIEHYLTLIKGQRISDQVLRQLWVRYLLLRDVADERRLPWLRLLAGLDRRIKSQLPPDPSWIEGYLFLRNLPYSDFRLDQLEMLVKLTIPQGLPLTFSLEWQKNLGEKYFHLGHTDQAIARFIEAQRIAPEGSRASLAVIRDELNFRRSLAP